jgi:hypothetical protein
MFTHDQALSAHLKSLQPSKPPRRRKSSETNVRSRPAAGTHLGVVAHLPKTGPFLFIRPDGPIEGLNPGDDLYAGPPALRRASNLAKGDRVSFGVRAAKRPGSIEAVNVQRAA